MPMFCQGFSHIKGKFFFFSLSRWNPKGRRTFREQRNPKLRISQCKGQYLVLDVSRIHLLARQGWESETRPMTYYKQKYGII